MFIITRLREIVLLLDACASRITHRTMQVNKRALKGSFAAIAALPAVVDYTIPESGRIA